MPFKLKLSSELPLNLDAAINMKLAESKGIFFKNRVPLVRDYPEYFEKIQLQEYNQGLSANSIKWGMNNDN